MSRFAADASAAAGGKVGWLKVPIFAPIVAACAPVIQIGNSSSNLSALYFSRPFFSDN